MSKSLYEISSDLYALERLQESVDSVDEDPTLADDILELKGERNRKLESCGHVIASLTAQEEEITKEIQRLTRLRKATQRNKQWLKYYILSDLKAHNQDKLVCGTRRFSVVRKTSKVLIYDLELIPEVYLHSEPKVDKALIREDLKSGVEVSGATIEEVEYLTIR